MSGPRARANHALYLARILLAAWRRELARQDIPAITLEQAFGAAAREHLVTAYGWFLLAICQAEAPGHTAPRSCSELPAMPAGRVFPAEINECRQLEAAGWLGDMLREPERVLPGVGQQGNLAVATGELPGSEQLERWLVALEALFERMGDSLDEY